MRTHRLATQLFLMLAVASVFAGFSTAKAQMASTTAAQIIASLPQPLPVEIQPFSTGAPDPHQPLDQIKSPTQVNCIHQQLTELQKVADAAGGNIALADAMKRARAKFVIISNDTTSGHPSQLVPHIYRAVPIPSARFNIVTLVSKDSNGIVGCQNVTSDKIISWLKADVNKQIPIPDAPGASVARPAKSAGAAH